MSVEETTPIPEPAPAFEKAAWKPGDALLDIEDDSPAGWMSAGECASYWNTMIISQGQGMPVVKTMSGTMDARFETDVRRVLAAYPPRAQDVLAREGVETWIVRTVAEHVPDVPGIESAGGALVFPKASPTGRYLILVTETVMGQPDNISLEYRLAHETGHFFDRNFWFSNSPEFRAAYSADVRRMNEVIEDMFAYQKDPAGKHPMRYLAGAVVLADMEYAQHTLPFAGEKKHRQARSEAFADLFAVAFDARVQDTQWRRPRILSELLPRSFAAVKEIVAEMGFTPVPPAEPRDMPVPSGP